MENSSNYFENYLVTYCPENIFNLFDGTLETEDGCSFPIHKFILARSSQFFYCLFCSLGNEKGGILIPRIKGVDLSNILSYLYTGNIHVTENNILDLIASSDYLQLDDLLFKLKQRLRKNLTPTNVLSVFKVSNELHLDEFSMECYRFVQLHFESVVRCEDAKIPELSLATLRVLLGDKNLRATSENIVWLSIIKWVEADTPNRSPFVPDLLKHLAISDVDENLANEILQHDIVAKNPSCQEIGKSLIYHAGSLQTLQCYLQTHIKPPTALCEQRQPSRLNLIAFQNTDIILTDDISIYVTYDEKIDLWRKLTGVSCASGWSFKLLFVNDCIYMLQRNRIQCYSIIEKQWNELVGFKEGRFDYADVTLNGFIYRLGGYIITDNGNIQVTGDVEIYDCENDEWHFTTPMLPVDPALSVIAYNDVIYTLGYNRNDLEHGMLAQAFDSASETWNVLPTPTSIRWRFAMVVYRGMIYVIGGISRDHQYITDVEVFDPIQNEWYTEVNLPSAYKFVKAIILNDKLIVYENLNRRRRRSAIHPPVQWNVHQKCWETLKNSTLQDLGKCTFLTIENSECISIISCENKDPATVFEHSPFS